MSIDIEDYLRRLNTKDLISALSDLRHLLEDDIGLDWEQVDNFSMSNSGTKHSCGNATHTIHKCHKVSATLSKADINARVIGAACELWIREVSHGGLIFDCKA